MKTQVMIGQLPLLYHQNPDKVLIVGLGSGVTAGSVLTHNVRVVDCVEISPSVVEASEYFANANHNALQDTRLEIIQRDARNMLLTSEESYDVIIAQPSNPWISGESALFSYEWYQLANEHLKSGGILLQWVPSYLISKRDLKVIIHTLKSVFPNLTLWTSGSVGDLILIAKKGAPLQVDYKTFLKKVNQPKIRDDIERVHLDPNLIPFYLFVMNQEELGNFLYQDLKTPLGKNTDDLLITEFSTPKQMNQNSRVSRFVAPEDLHGNLTSLFKILRNVSKDDLKNFFKIEKDSPLEEML